MTRSAETTDCRCLECGPRAPDIAYEGELGIDVTDGRFANVSLQICSGCGRGWLHYLQEAEYETAAGRWAEALIDPDDASAMTPERAAEYIGTAPWRIVGGSYYGSAGKRVSRRGWPARLPESVAGNDDRERDGERDAFRAAGQAYAAAVLGLPIKHANVRGVELNWPANRAIGWDHSRSEVAMALAGIAAVARYGFGMTPDGEISFDYRVLTDQGRIDFDTASQMADDIDPGGKRHVLGEAWTLAASLVADPESWAAIEWLAGIVEGVELDGVAVAHIVLPNEGFPAAQGRECPA
jgi:hypothetical protein